jgi:hypothetical protein
MTIPVKQIGPLAPVRYTGNPNIAMRSCMRQTIRCPQTLIVAIVY